MGIETGWAGESETDSRGCPDAGTWIKKGRLRARMRVELKDSESFEQLLKRFTKGIERSGIIREHRRGLRFISVQEENRAKRRKAERRRRRNAA